MSELSFGLDQANIRAADLPFPRDTVDATETPTPREYAKIRSDV